MHVENPLSATDTYLITVKKIHKFEYDVGVDFIQIRVLIQSKKNWAVLLKWLRPRRDSMCMCIYSPALFKEAFTADGKL